LHSLSSGGPYRRKNNSDRPFNSVVEYHIEIHLRKIATALQAGSTNFTLREEYMLVRCTICNHDRRQEIEQALLRGDSHQTISLQFSVSRGVVSRHLRHIGEAVKRARELAEVEIERGKSVLMQLRELVSQAQYLGLRAERAGDIRTGLAALRDLTRILELEARLTGELNEKPETKVLNLNLDPDTARRITETFLARHKERIQNE
jgi:hypothetical protein